MPFGLNERMNSCVAFRAPCSGRRRGAVPGLGLRGRGRSLWEPSLGSEKAGGEEVFLSHSFVWSLPSSCERVGLGAPGWGNNYPEHSCDLLGLVNIPQSTPLNFASRLGLFAGTQTAASGSWPLGEERLGGADSDSLSGKPVDPARLAAVGPRNVPRIRRMWTDFSAIPDMVFPVLKRMDPSEFKSNLRRERKIAWRHSALQASLSLATLSV